MKPLTTEQENLIRYQYNKGYGIGMIAKAFGIGEDQVRKIVGWKWFN